LERLVDALAASAGESEIPILDFYHLFLDDNGGVQGEYFLEDGLHPNKKGHLLMATKAAQFLKSTFYLA
jgi:lysophospholipase L1-like esterase